MRTVLILVFIFGIIIPVWGASEYLHHALVEVLLIDNAQIGELAKLHLDVVPGETPWTPRVVALPDDLTKLAQAGFSYRILHADIEQYFADRARAEGHLDDMGGYRTFSEIVAALDSMHLRYPAITTAKFSIGQSIEGRSLWCLKISDNPDSDENEPELFFNALIHSREPAAMEAVLYFMNYLLEHYATDTIAASLVNSREMFFIPCINPDGYEYNRITNPSGGGMWRKNRRNNGDGSYGVDLNRNWGLTWGIDNSGSSSWPADETYRGAAPFSEPETAALRDFINARDFAGSIDFHTYSNLVLFPWGTDYLDGTGLCRDDPQFRFIADSLSHAIWQVNGAGYKTGTPWEILYNTNGGSTDWEYGDTTLHSKMFSLTIEIGNTSDDFWPPPSRIAPLCAENLAANLFFARYVGTFSLGNPDASITPGILNYEVGPAEVAERQIFISNTGTRNLEYAIRFGHDATYPDSGETYAFGYHWQDSATVCGPVFQWLPISAAGTPVTFGAGDGDAVRGPFQLGFDFPYYDRSYNRLWISGNGWISFLDSTNTYAYNSYLPLSYSPAASICAWWDDLQPNLAGTNIRFWTNGIDSAAAHFENVRAGSAPYQGVYNFQILLTARGEIILYYGNMGTNRLNSATIGMQDHRRTRGFTILWNMAGVGNNVARRIALGPRWVTAIPDGGMVSPGQTDTITVRVVGAQLCGDSSLASLLIRSNDTETPVMTIPIYANRVLLAVPAHLTSIYTPNGIRLRWNSSENAAGYIVERASAWFSPFEFLAATADTVFCDTSAFSYEGPLYYRVRAASNDGGTAR